MSYTLNVGQVGVSVLNTHLPQGSGQVHRCVVQAPSLDASAGKATG